MPHGGVVELVALDSNAHVPRADDIFLGLLLCFFHRTCSLYTGHSDILLVIDVILTDWAFGYHI